ncbi:MAG TPA: M1 family metallopeptidase [Anaerolineae bacterium]|nr:M1 family metallopeptidase [Anaerolineae bacterium]
MPTLGRGGQPADPLAAHRAAMAPSQRSLLDTLPLLPEVRMDVRVDPAEPLLTGKMTMTLPPEPDGALLPEYFFRLYPNLSYYGGSMGVTLATVNGIGAPFDYHANDTAVRVVAPPGATQPGEPVTIGLQWRLRPPVWDDERYHLMGAGGGVLALPAFYPMLAVRDADAPDGWRLDISMLQGDSVFSPAATFQVTATVPTSYQVAATGSVIGVEDVPAPTPEGEAPASVPTWTSWRMASGPAREFAMFISDQYGLAETYANDVRINSWYRLGDEVAGRAAAEYAAAGLRVYSELFGPYPYAELDVVAGPLEFRGMEYPGLFELGFQLYREHANELEFRIAHEVAHQWWYNVVGNDVVNAPWLDEGLAEFATYFYVQRINGQAFADRLVQRRWVAALEVARQRGLDAAVDQPVDAFEGNYETIVYGKAALFHHALLEALGEEAYLALLRTYVERFRFREATPDDFLALAVELGGPQVEELYQRWILQAEAPSTDTAEQ